MASPLEQRAMPSWSDVFIFRKIPSHLTFPIYSLWQARARGVPHFLGLLPLKRDRFPPLDLEWIWYKYKLSRPLLWHTLSGEIHPWKCKISPAEFSFSGIAHFFVLVVLYFVSFVYTFSSRCCLLFITFQLMLYYRSFYGGFSPKFWWSVDGTSMEFSGPPSGGGRWSEGDSNKLNYFSWIFNTALGWGSEFVRRYEWSYAIDKITDSMGQLALTLFSF